MCPEIAFLKSPEELPVAERILDYVFAPDQDRTIAAFVERYQVLSSGEDPLPIAPAESNILAKMVWPLRSAKGNYALGNYLACIAMCGLVGEMAAMLLWDVASINLQGRVLDEKLEKLFLGSSFERLGQERRVNVLVAAGVIDEEAKSSFDALREIRRKHLHFLSHPHEQAKGDAQRAFFAAASTLKPLFGVSNGDVSLRPELAAYLRKHDVLDDDSGPQA
jgi:hypothetical protein